MTTQGTVKSNQLTEAIAFVAGDEIIIGRGGKYYRISFDQVFSAANITFDDGNSPALYTTVQAALAAALAGAGGGASTAADVSFDDGNSPAIYSTVQAALAAALAGVGSREVLSGDRTYYVRSDGSDSNDGLTNSSGGAFLTLQKAVDVVGTLDLSIYDVTIQIGIAGTYAGFTVDGPFVGGAGSSVSIVGDTGSPGSYVLSTRAYATNGGRFRIRGVDFTSSNLGVDAEKDSNIIVDGTVIFGACTTAHIRAQYNSSVRISANYTIDGGTANHLLSQYGSFVFAAGLTVTLTGTPAFSSYFANAEACGTAQLNGNTYSGSATGARYSATLNGVLNTLGGGASYLPGDSAGSTATGGQYA